MSATPAFTSGPWESRPGRHLFGAEIFGQNRFVAAVMSWEGLDAEKQAEAKANAALIAAAPDLYAVVCSLFDTTPTADIFDRAAAAIAKAEGRPMTLPEHTRLARFIPRSPETVSTLRWFALVSIIAMGVLAFEFVAPMAMRAGQ